MAASMARGNNETHDGGDSQDIPKEVAVTKKVIGAVAANQMIGMKHEVPSFFGPFEIENDLEELRPKACFHRHGDPRQMKSRANTTRSRMIIRDCRHA
jgi:hypothetical protein